MDPGISPRVLDGFVDGAVSGAAADVAGESGLHRLAGWLRAKRHGGEDHAGRADAALRAAKPDERLLQWMVATEAFNRRHAPARHLRERHQARVHRLAVHNHGARATLPFA